MDSESGSIGKFFCKYLNSNLSLEAFRRVRDLKYSSPVVLERSFQIRYKADPELQYALQEKTRRKKFKNSAFVLLKTV